MSGCTGDQGPAGDQGPPGDPGESCTATNNGDGTYTLVCGDQTIIVSDGTDGVDGTDGTDGTDGLPGENCTAVDNGDGTYTITCGTTVIVVSDGQDGPTGPTGPSSADVFYVWSEIPEELGATFDSITIGSPTVVEFTVTDGFGRGAVGLVAGSTGNVRAGLAKLVPGASGDASRWQSYINRSSTGTLGTFTQATVERTGVLVDHGDGTYTYTFATDPATATDPVSGALIGYDPALTHRVALQISGGGLPAVNVVNDSVPSGAAVTELREIAATDSCNECHDKITLHGSRYDVRYCAVCHNPGTTDADTGNTADMKVMTHKIHMGLNLPSVLAGGTYELGGHDYSHVGYPQSAANCRKCHDGTDAATPQGDNWKNKPTAQACGACHDDVDFAAGVGHSMQANNSLCAACHSASAIEGFHTTDYATPNNPSVPAGLSSFTYEILSATIDAGNHPVVEFRILRDGTAMDLAGTTLPTGFSGGPSFLLAFALPQDGIDTPIDYNNRGLAAAQPTSVSLANLRAGTAGTVAAGTAGSYVATFTYAFPAGSSLRAVALQGYFTQTVSGVGHGRHTNSVAKSFTGDTPRRLIADSQKCTACHEFFEGHGGNRNILLGDPASAPTEQMVCTLCHVPNLSSSGKTMDLTYAEDTNNLRDMVHGIHASAKRTTPYTFVRIRSGNAYFFDWSHVGFPAEYGTSNCNLCHLPETYYPPEGSFPTTMMTTDGTNATPADVTAARAALPNATDVVISPAASSCYYCHDTQAAAAHMELNGGAVGWTRAEYDAAAPVETCSVCHGPDRLFDVKLLHGLD